MINHEYSKTKKLINATPEIPPMIGTDYGEMYGHLCREIGDSNAFDNLVADLMFCIVNFIADDCLWSMK